MGCEASFLRVCLIAGYTGGIFFKTVGALNDSDLSAGMVTTMDTKASRVVNCRDMVSKDALNEAAKGI